MKLKPYRGPWNELMVYDPAKYAMNEQPLLTTEEHEIADALGEINTRMCRLCDEALDRQEICALIHALQARVMSHAAARAYPNLYRKL